MKYLLSIFLILCFVFLYRVGATENLGTPASILSGITKQNTKATFFYSFVISFSEKINVHADFFYFQDGELAMSGKAIESENSLFILKGDKETIFGWVALKDKNIAYEYTTDNSGNVIVEQVPVSKVIAIDDNDISEGDYSPVKIPEYHYPFKTLPPIPHIGDYNGQNLNKLESMPGAKKGLFLDIADMMNGDVPKTASKEDIWKNWQGVSNAFAIYKINVTTNSAVATALGKANYGIAKYNNGVGRSSSPVGAFGTGQYSNMYRVRGRPGYDTSGYTLSLRTAHELGHLSGLGHERGIPGRENGEYFFGHPKYKWYVIMGDEWQGIGDNEVTYQWSKGEYTTATNFQDDFKVMMTCDKVEYRDEDHVGVTPLKFTGAIQIDAVNNYGQISPNTDLDTFSFEIKEEKGHCMLKIGRLEYIGGNMLDLDAIILDASGKVVAHNNPEVIRSATFDLDLNMGTYMLVIQGGAEGSPQDGFSKYSSMGFYGMEGEITGGGTGIKTPEYLSSVIRISPVLTNGIIKLYFPKNSVVDKISVFSMKGAMVFHTQEKTNFIVLSGVATGSYIFYINVDGNRIVKRVFVNKYGK